MTVVLVSLFVLLRFFAVDSALVGVQYSCFGDGVCRECMDQKTCKKGTGLCEALPMCDPMATRWKKECDEMCPPKAYECDPRKGTCKECPLCIAVKGGKSCKSPCKKEENTYSDRQSCEDTCLKDYKANKLKSCSAKKNEVATNCTRCEPTCDPSHYLNCPYPLLHTVDDLRHFDCDEPGCVCKMGFLKQKGKCVLKHQCRPECMEDQHYEEEACPQPTCKAPTVSSKAKCNKAVCVCNDPTLYLNGDKECVELKECKEEWRHQCDPGKRQCSLCSNRSRPKCKSNLPVFYYHHQCAVKCKAGDVMEAGKIEKNKEKKTKQKDLEETTENPVTETTDGSLYLDPDRVDYGGANYEYYNYYVYDENAAQANGLELGGGFLFG